MTCEKNWYVTNAISYTLPDWGVSMVADVDARITFCWTVAGVHGKDGEKLAKQT
jgi:hypothetical protein